MWDLGYLTRVQFPPKADFNSLCNVTLSIRFFLSQIIMKENKLRPDYHNISDIVSVN